jgi:DNA polymerase
MTPLFHVDYETFSTSELSDVGAYRYAEDASTEILMLAIAQGDSEPYLWLPPRWREAFPDLHDIEAEGLLLELRDTPDAIVVAHNAQFERAITMYADTPLSFFMRERPKQWRCTAAMARRAAVPDSLEKCGEYLDVEAKKDSRGKTLIRKFSMLQTAGKRKGERVLPTEEPQAFREFAAYCLQDVRTEQAIHKALKPFELVGPDVLDTFLLDIHLNDRGIPVNLPALRNARRIVDDLMANRTTEFVALTGLQPTQREAVKGWLAAKGVVLEDMQGDTLAEAVKRIDLAPDALRCLELYSELRFAAVKKVHTMLDSANADGRVRGTLLYHGAGTGRWSGRGMQPQNFKKPTIKHLKGAFEMLEKGCTADDLDMLYGAPLEVISSCIRNFITATLDADYNAVEPRILVWLAGQEDALERWRKFDAMVEKLGKVDTPDLAAVEPYRVQAGVIYNVSPRTLHKDGTERQLGKQTTIGCGYQMSGPKFLTTCHNYNLMFVDEALANRSVESYRASHPKVVQLWWDCDTAAKRAFAQVGRRFSAGDKLSFQCRMVAEKLFLFMRLPSGREIAYPDPKIETDPQYGRENITYYGAIPGKAIWGRVKMYGGKWVENADQAVAASLMAYGLNNALRGGYDVWTTVHDQGLGTLKPNQTAAEFGKLLATLPPWAAGLPLKAEAKTCKFYAK